MPDRLRKYINEGLQRKGLQKKHLVLELTSSKSQYYRFINARARPPQTFVDKLVEKLELDADVFWRLYREVEQVLLQNSVEKSMGILSSDATPKTNEINLPTNGGDIVNKLWNAARYHSHLFIAVVLIIFLAIFILDSSLNHQVDRESPKRRYFPTASELKLKPFSKINGDNSIFVRDVTIPDGTPITINTQYDKVWRVRNTGKITWENRYLKRMTPQGNSLCMSADKVPIPKTIPGEEVDIQITFVTRDTPGSCRTDWKMINEKGDIYFPNLISLFSVVEVVTQ